MIFFVENLVKSFGADVILDGASMKIEDGERIGLIGANGCGKTTFLRILTGEETFDSGNLAFGSGKKIGHLKQNGGLDDENDVLTELQKPFEKFSDIWEKLRLLEEKISVTQDAEEYARLVKEYSHLEDVFESGDGYMCEVKIRTVLGGMGFSGMEKTLVKNLSGGEKTRLALAKLLLEDPDLLILDEPTNHLDFKTLDWLEEYLAGYKGALLTVSHDRYFLDKTVRVICEIENKKIVRYNGNYSKYVTLRDERLTRLQKEYDAHTEKIAKLREYAEKNIARASTSASAKSRLAAIDRMDIPEAPVPPEKPPVFRFEFERDPVKDVLIAENLSLRVGENGETELMHGVNLSVRRGEKVAIVGTNGVGKTTLLKTVCGRLPLFKGKVTVGKNVKVGYYDQHMSGINPEKTVINELWDRNPKSYEFDIRTALGRVGLRGDDVYKKNSALSGGEKAKLAFCILMAEKANVLVLDEPTNHLDISAKEALDKALSEFPGTVIMVSHDRYLLSRVPDRIIDMTGTSMDEYIGGYATYLEKKHGKKDSFAPVRVNDRKRFEYERDKPVLPTLPTHEKPAYRSKKERAEQVKKRAEIRRLEEEIAFLENSVKILEEKISSPEIASDYKEITKRCEEMERLRAETDEKYEEWLLLSGETEKEI